MNGYLGGDVTPFCKQRTVIECLHHEGIKQADTFQNSKTTQRQGNVLAYSLSVARYIQIISFGWRQQRRI